MQCFGDRIFNCDCGYVEDRDYNASLNLRDAKISKTAPACIGQMCGFGEKGYVLAMEALEDYITRNK